MAKRITKKRGLRRAKNTSDAIAGSGRAAQYPRHPLERALRIPRAILEQNAGRPCTPAEAAKFAGGSFSGPFKSELASAGKYGFARRCDHRASFGTQKMFSERYSSGSSGSAPSARWLKSNEWRSSKASEMYLRKISPRTMCLYSAASMLLRSLSAAAHKVVSNPRFAPPFVFLLVRFATVPP